MPLSIEERLDIKSTINLFYYFIIKQLILVVMKYDHLRLLYLKLINSRFINDNMTRYYSCLTTNQTGSLAKNQERKTDKLKVYI